MTGNQDNPQYREVAARLRLLLRAWRMNAVLKGLIAAAVAFWLPVAAGILLGAEGAPRTWVLGVAAVAGVCVLAVFSLWPLVRPLRLLDAAFLAERSSPELKGLAAAAVELYSAETKHENFNTGMMDALAAQAAAAAPRLNIPSAISIGTTVKFALAGAGVLIVSVLLLHAAKAGAGDVARFLSPPYLPAPEYFELVSVSGDITAPLGGAVEIQLTARGSAGNHPVLIMEREGLEPYELKLEETSREDDLREYEAALESVAGDMAYRVSATGFLSDTYHIFTVEPPAVAGLALTLTYPEYTGLLPDRREAGGDIRAPFGTKVRLEVESSSEISRAYITMDGEDIALEKEGDKTAAGEFTVEKDARYSLRIEDTLGFENRFPPEYVIESVPDADPEVTLIYPDNDMTVSRVSTIKIRGGANDDYMIASARLHWKIIGTEKKDSVPIPVTPGGEVLFEYPWDLGDVEAYEGDVLEYFISATDNDALTGPKTAYSAVRKVHLLSRYEDYEEGREDQAEIISRMESAVREGEMLSEKFRDLARTLDTSSDGSRQWKAEANRAMDRMQGLEKELGDISKNMRDSISRMQNNELVNMDSLSKMQEIDNLMRDIMTDEMRDLIEKVRKNVQNTSLQNVDKDLVAAMRNQDRIMESLDRTLQKLKKIRAEQEMEALRRQLESLAKRQEDLLERSQDLAASTKNGKPEGPQVQEALRQAREQEKIRNETQSAMDSMERLGGEMQDFNPESGREMQRLAEMGRQENVDGNMRDAEQCLRSGNMGQCTSGEKKALDTLRKMSGGLDSLAEDYNTNMDEETKQLIRQLLVRTLDISEAHEAALEVSERSSEQQNMKFPGELKEKVIREENMVREAAGFLAEDIGRLSIMTMAVSPRTAGLAMEAAESVENAVGFLAEENTSRALGTQRIGAKKFNQLALALLDARSRAGQKSGGSALGDFMKELQKLAGSQEALNAATSRLGASGMTIPGMGDALQSLALQQQMIGEGLGQLAEEMKRMGEYGERLGQIQDEMEKIQAALAEGDTGPEVQRRQSKVLRRLKDASLSLKKEVLEENRVAEKADEYEVEPPPEVRDLLREALPEEVIRELEQFRKEPRPKGYERLIEKYYNELMRSEPANGAE